MEIAARRAEDDDIGTITELYTELAAEQAALRPLWPYADGFDEPARASIQQVLREPDPLLYVGTLDGVALGFLWATIDPLLAQAGGVRVGTIRMIHTHVEARGVGIAEAMIDMVLADLVARDVHLFDALVSPGHRAAKNFFESQGFKARLIVMHHADDSTPVSPRGRTLGSPSRLAASE